MPLDFSKGLFKPIPEQELSKMGLVESIEYVKRIVKLTGRFRMFIDPVRGSDEQTGYCLHVIEYGEPITHIYVMTRAYRDYPALIRDNAHIGWRPWVRAESARAVMTVIFDIMKDYGYIDRHGVSLSS